MTNKLSNKIPIELHKVITHVDNNSTKYVENLRELIRQPSISAQNKGMKECVRLIEQKMSQSGIKTKIIPTKGYPVIFAEVKSKGAQKTILFYGHYDVQPPEPLNEWKHQPFAAEIIDDKIFGRGSSDMKCGIMALINSIDSYLKVENQIPVNIKIIFEGEEEIGSPNLENFVKDNKELLKADARIGFDGSTNRVSLGGKGMLYVQLDCRENRSDFHSREATILVSPVWRLIRALNTLKDESERILIKGFYDNILDPTHEDVDLLKNIQIRPEEIYNGRTLDGLETKIKLLHRRTFSPTCNICGIISGYTGTGSKTVIPHIATAKVDFRLVPDQDPIDINNKLQLHLANHGFDDINITTIGTLWPYKTSIQEEISQVAIKSIETVCPNIQVVPIHPGSGPSYIFIKNLNTPTVNTGANTTSKLNHAPNEYVKCEDYIAGIKKAAAIMYYFGS